MENSQKIHNVNVSLYLRDRKESFNIEFNSVIALHESDIYKMLAKSFPAYLRYTECDENKFEDGNFYGFDLTFMNGLQTISIFRNN